MSADKTIEYIKSKHLKLGTIAETLGESRFYVFLYTNINDLNTGVIILCELRKKLKTRYRNSYKRITTNSVVGVHYNINEEPGYIEILFNVDANFKSLYHLPFYAT